MKLNPKTKEKIGDWLARISIAAVIILTIIIITIMVGNVIIDNLPDPNSNVTMYLAK